MSKNALDRFSSKSFMISGFTYKSLSHFAFLFIYGVKKCSNLIVIHVAVQFSQNYLFKRLSFSIVYSYLLCHTLIGQRFLDLFLDSKFCTIDWFFCFCTSTSPFFFFFFFFAMPMPCGSSQARDQTCIRAVTWAAAVTMPYP